MPPGAAAARDGSPPGLTHYLYPGELFADPRPHLVTTVLGSCVAVCLYDPARGVGGINHYLLPLWNGEGLPTPRYGNIAIDALLDRMLLLGCQRGSLQAKLFGGAAMWENPGGLFSVGERNIELARRRLGELRIPVIGADVGGDGGRKILFNSGDGTVLLRRNRGVPVAGRAAPQDARAG
jgi:chemotaxis protein CheD